MKFASRPFFFLLLSLVLLFAQQGAARHNLSHLSEPLSSHQQQDKQLPHSPACDKCVVYAGLGSALTANSLAIPNLSIQFVHLATSAPLLLLQAVRIYLARAPPVRT